MLGAMIYAYEREPYEASLATDVLAAGEDGGRPYAVLGDTIFYPEGGGQPSDRGRIGEVAVVDVQRVDGEVRHYLASAVERGAASLELDWYRRFDHMQQHTAQHLLTAVAAGRFGWETTSFHLQAKICDVELDTASISPAELEALEDAVVAEVVAGRAVTARRVGPEELAGIRVRSRGLPEGFEGDVRLVEIAGLDTTTCGGTHLRSTSEIETVKLLGTEGLRGGTRLFWLAGARVRRRLGRHEARNAELRSVLGTGDDEIVAIARHKLAQLKEASRGRKAVEARLAEAVAEGLAGKADSVVDAHFDGADMGFLQQVARRFSASEHSGVALLTASGDAGTFFLLAAGGASQADLQEAGRRVASALGGRGGGSGRIFQGKAESLERRAEALGVLR